jgi:hypothetical protein
MAKFPINVAAFIEEAADPAVVLNNAQVYAKDVTGITQLFCRASDGTVYQLTPPGAAAYTPGVPANWSPVPTTLAGAFDQLALTNAPETVSSPLLTAIPPIQQTTRVLGAPPRFEGGIYTCTKRVLLTNLRIRATAGGGGSTFRVAVYQNPNGTLGGALPLLFTADSPVIPAAANVTVPVPSVLLAEGQYVVLIGRAAGAITLTLRVWSLPATLDGFTANVPAGSIPYQFTTALDSSLAPPATFDPAVTGVVTTTNVCPAFRGGS